MSDLKKAAIKEGTKKGHDLQGLADMGGTSYFVAAIDSAQGDVDALTAAMDGAQEESKDVGKMFVSASEMEQLVVIAYIPESKTEIDINEWLKAATESLGAVEHAKKPTQITMIAKADSTKELFPIKMKDQLINQSIAFLKEKKVFPEMDDDDDDIVYGDDAIGSF
eukprot:GHVL01026529.1.p1 GENE.GHVL01026529.1~~GHVL01026529.1.p1  ORF type:complete len:181 (+),score=50.68 GHVL01026529.1:47-544(+)